LPDPARLLIERGLKHLPVIDADGALVGSSAGALVGIVSRADLIKTFLRSDDDIRNAVVTDVFFQVLWADPTQVDIAVTDGIVTSPAASGSAVPSRSLKTSSVASTSSWTSSPRWATASTTAASPPGPPHEHLTIQRNPYPRHDLSRSGHPPTSATHSRRHRRSPLLSGMPKWAASARTRLSCA